MDINKNPLKPYLKSLADKFREKFGMTDFEELNAQDFPDLIDEVYEYGRQAGGGSVDTDEIYKQAQKEVWRGITNNGTREHYANGFQYQDLAYLYPYFSMTPTNAGYMFAQTKNGGQLDFVDRFGQFGTTLDFSRATSMARTFYVSGATRLGVIDCTSATSLEYLVSSSSYLHTIEKMIVRAENTYNSAFNAANALVEIRFEGEIGNDIDFSTCSNLSHESILSIIGHLKQGAGKTLTLGATNLAKSDDYINLIESKGWDYR